jgi:phosphoribosyl-ATP pyrophosphohydrolase/phosphoribosyl-AMP cyclohydrolase
VNRFDPSRLDWQKGSGLLPAMVQHADSGAVLMLGFMNPAALEATLSSRRVTFWSRTRSRLWTKGEQSVNFLALDAVHADCDADALLVLARPSGPVCHTGSATCFPDPARPTLAFLSTLDALVAERARERPPESYVTRLFEAGTERIAQKVGEEAVETALAAVTRDADGLLDEAADLMFHLLVLLRARGSGLDALVARLAARHAAR